MKFYTAYDRPDEAVCPLEYHQDEGKVERDGYMTIEQQVNEFIRAGEMLEAYRNAEYPADDDIPDDAPANYPRNRLDALYELGQVYKVLKNSQKKDEEVKKEEKEKEEENVKDIKDGNT